MSCQNIQNVHETPYMWQMPNLHAKYPNSPIWYTCGHLGKGPLGSFISELCAKVGTSKHCTNHCVRVSTTNVITCTGLFNDKEVMEMMGHKSSESLQLYRCVCPEKKMEMAKVLGSAINKKMINILMNSKQKIKRNLLLSHPDQ